MFSVRIMTDHVSCLVIHRHNIMTNNAYGYHDLDPPYSVSLSHTPTSKMTNTQTEWSLTELSAPLAIKLFQTDRTSHNTSAVAPRLNDIWQQSYIFITPVIKSGPLSVQKFLYAQLIICKWTKEIQHNACLQLILFLLLNAYTHLATVQKNRARPRDASCSSTSYNHAFMLWRIIISCTNTVTLYSLSSLNEISNTTFAVKMSVYPRTYIPIWC